MNDENTKKLVTRYPNLFRHTFYFECHDGWFDLIDKCAKQITELDKSIVASQVKEKYGTLRFYICPTESDNFDKVCEIIATYEDKSASTCEMCGGLGTLKKKLGWYRTICNLCSL